MKMLPSSFLVSVTIPLLFRSICVVNGLDSKDLQADLMAISDRFDELTKNFHLKNQVIERLEVELNSQKFTIEEQKKEIDKLRENQDNLKLKVSSLESLLSGWVQQKSTAFKISVPGTQIDLNQATKKKDAGLSKLFSKQTRTKEDLKRLGEMILEIGVDSIERNATLRYGPKVLFDFCQNYNDDNLLDIVKNLTSTGIDVNYVDESGRNSLLFLSSQYRNENLLEIIKLLISNGIEVNFEDDANSENVLQILSQTYKHENLLDIIKLLISAEIDVNQQNFSGLNAFHRLSQNYNNENLLEIVKLLISSGINVKQVNNYGKTALHYLCMNYKKENLFDIVKLLIATGIDVRKKDRDGNKALHYLKKYYKNQNKEEIINILQ